MAKMSAPTAPSFVVLAFRNGLEYCKADGRVNGAYDSSTSCRNLVSFRPVTPKITQLECGQQA